MDHSPFVVGIGGTFSTGSSTEKAVRGVLNHAEALGARVMMFAGDAIDLPMYKPATAVAGSDAFALIQAMRTADALIIGSPGYHGGISGLVKNAIDYAEELARDERPYFTDRPVGCVATGLGWQGCNYTLQALRNVAHALRGWPTPLGIALNTREPAFKNDGSCISADLDSQMQIMARQLLSGHEFPKVTDPARK